MSEWEGFSAYLKMICREAKAEALLEFAKSVDLEAVADEWSGGTDDGRWSAGNGASAVLNVAYDMAAALQKGAKK